MLPQIHMGSQNAPKNWKRNSWIKGREIVWGCTSLDLCHLFAKGMHTHFSVYVPDWQPEYWWGTAFTGERLCGHRSVYSVLMSSMLSLTPMRCVHAWTETDTWEVEENKERKEERNISLSRAEGCLEMNNVWLNCFELVCLAFFYSMHDVKIVKSKN